MFPGGPRPNSTGFSDPCVYCKLQNVLAWHLGSSALKDMKIRMCLMLLNIREQNPFESIDKKL